MTGPLKNGLRLRKRCRHLPSSPSLPQFQVKHVMIAHHKQKENYMYSLTPRPSLPSSFWLLKFEWSGTTPCVYLPPQLSVYLTSLHMTKSPRPSTLQLLITYSLQKWRGKTWKISMMWCNDRYTDGGAVPNEESRGPSCNILSRDCDIRKTAPW